MTSADRRRRARAGRSGGDRQRRAGRPATTCRWGRRAGRPRSGAGPVTLTLRSTEQPDTAPSSATSTWTCPARSKSP